MIRAMAVDKRTPSKRKSHGKPPSNTRLDRMIDEALIDAYGESEQMVGFYTILEGNLVVPFDTEILGVEATVELVDMTEDEQIVAVCTCGKSRQRVPILDLPLPDPPPAGAELIDECLDDVIFFADEAGLWQVGVDWNKVLPSWFRVLPATAVSDIANRNTGQRPRGRKP